MTQTRPCIHPTCKDVDGNPRLTQDIMCYPSRSYYRKQLGWFVADYVTLRHDLPIFTGTGHSTRQSYGHPAEWASDQCAEIAGLLNDAENEVRAHLGDEPALYVVGERAKVNNATRYLGDRWDVFCTFPNADSYAEAITDTHRTIRATLGLTRLIERLPMPCPTCEELALIKEVGQIYCTNDACQRVIPEKDYPMLTRIASQWAVDKLIEAYDAQETAKLDTQKLNSV